ncbi:MAG: branched-chain-amino-acid transaminase [Elusimicrobia bacterium]|nr:branched-chain-amino-acid transaminase [Elusimicrobiota bacterium]
MKIYLNGKLVSREQAQISVFDHGLLYGDGVFEGIRAYHGRVFKLREHLDRLANSAQAILLTIPLTKEELEAAIIETLQANSLKDAYVRVIVTRGVGDLGLDPQKCLRPSIVIIADRIALYPEEYYSHGLEVITATTKRNLPEAINPCIKSLNYLNNILAKIEASRANVPEAILLNKDGYVAECTGDNLFLVRGGVGGGLEETTLVTPPTSVGVLEGITRATVMDLAKTRLKLLVKEEPFTVYHVYTAAEVFLTGTAAEVIPVVKVDGRRIGEGKPGKVTHRLIKEFRELTRLTGVPIRGGT